MRKTPWPFSVVFVLCLLGCSTPAPALPPSPTLTPKPQIAYESDREGNWEIYVMNPDGSDPVNLTQHGASDRYPAWSPDGTRIAFQSDRGGNDEIYLMYADGSQVTRLTRNKERDLLPAWSPDGARLSFATDRYGGMTVLTMNADGSGQKRLTERTTAGGSSHWSPDGTQIVLDILEQHYISRIYVIGADGSGLTPLTPYGSYRVASPAWSPDGARIAFVSEEGHQGKMDLYVMKHESSRILG